MTRKHSKPPMELDLESFLDSHTTTDDDDVDDDDDSNDHQRLPSLPYRTVDEILLNDDSDTSPSSSSPTSPSSLTHRSYLRAEDVSVSNPKTNPVDETPLDSSELSHSQLVLDNDRPPPESKFSLYNRIKSGDFSGDSLSLSQQNVRRPLPPLFGVVRSNAKPGAALAAAAAASRSIPTPHAAAIKLRRATLSKVLDNTHDLEESTSGITSSEMIYESGTGSEIGQSDAKLVEQDVHSDNILPTTEVDTMAKFDISGELVTEHEMSGYYSCEEMPTEVANESKVIEAGFDGLGEVKFSSDNKPHENSEGQNLDDECTSSVLNGDSNKHVKENNDLSPPSESIIEELPFSTEHDKGRQVEEDSAIASSLEKQDSENAKILSKDGEFGLVGDDTSTQTDDASVIETLEDILRQLETKKSGKRTGKRSRSSMKPIQLAEELEKKQAFTGLHWEEGAAAQPMRLEGVRRGSTVLGYFDITADNTITRTISSQAFRRDHGSPQVVAVHLNFIAVGMSRGVIVVIPSKYSPYYADNMDSKMIMLGLQGDRSYAPVTSMCFNQPGDLLFAGYADGHYTVWDLQKVSAAKVVSEHKAPVVHMLYLGQDSPVTRHFNVVSGDCKGVVKLIRFSPFSWLNRFSISKTSPLLDESTSTVVCASPLLSDECFGGPSTSSTVSTSGIGSMMGGVVGGDWKSLEGSSLVEEGVVIFITHQSALVAKVDANPPEVYAKLPKPEGVREGSMPYTAWKYMPHSQGYSAENVPVQESETVPLLAIAWDWKVQVVKLVKSELKIYAKWTLDSSAIGVAWLDDQMLVVLTSAGHLCLFAKDGTVIHKTSFAIDGSRGDDLIGYHTHFTNIFGNPEKAHHNFVAVRGATLYILGPTHLVVSRLLPWKERIEVLRKAGDWMGALNMAMTLYDGQAHGVIDLPRTLNDVQNAIMPYLVELLFSYVDEVFSYISVAFCNQIGKLEQVEDSKSDSGVVHSEIKEQFTRVGGVAVEFCVHIKRTDILFDEILSRFVSVQHKETFLELLEPYILKDMLGSLPPEVMQALVEHYSTKGWLQRVEQCVLHMDISSLDFNQVVRLCREHRLYGALIYLFNKGLDDFRTPLEELLVVLRDSQSEISASLGYRMLVYLKYCFTGLAFPPGHGTLSPARLPSLRIELIHFLLEDSNAPSSWGITSSSSTQAYKNLYHLLELDTEATLDVLRCAFIKEEIPKPDYSLHKPTNLILEPMNGNDSMDESQNLVQEIVNVLALMLEAGRSSSTDDDISKAIWPSKDDIGHVFEFIAYYVSRGEAKVSKQLLSQVLEYLTSVVDIPSSLSKQNVETLRRREKKVLALLEVVPETDWDDTYLLHLCEKAQFFQVCGFIHDIRHRYLYAMDSYTKDVDEPIHVFSFIDDMLRRTTDEKSDSFEAAVISRIPDLVQLNREGTFFLVFEHFSEESQKILAELQSYPRSLFLYLKTVIEVHSTGTLNFSCLRKGDTQDMHGRRRDRVQVFLARISDFPKFMRDNPVHVTDEMIELYLELLCQYERSSVLQFLETCESYRVEHCLRLCQENGVIDAAAFLLERVGDVGSALLLTLSDLRDRFSMLDSTVQSVFDDDAGVEHFNAVLKKKEVNDMLDIVHACVGLCQRNSPRLDPDESESLWFQLLDSFCQPLMDSCNARMGSKGEKQTGNSAESFGGQNDACKFTWKVTKSDKGAQILRKLFSMFIKEIVEGMIGYVRLPTIMLKLLSDNATQEFGDFKVTILGMLGIYDFERRILDTAKSLIEDDTYYTMSLLKKGASHGYGPRSLLCCICNCLLSKDFSTSAIRVFSCGHASHLHCEQQEKETSRRGNSTGCPICMPKKKGQRPESKSVLAENGLVSKPLLKHKLPQGVGAPHPHENDALDGYRQISRFEILSNLQKDKGMIQLENMPQLRLAPPAVYHEKVKKGNNMLRGESSSSNHSKIEKASKSKQLRDVKVKGSSIRFPLKSNIFGKEKTSKR